MKFGCKTAKSEKDVEEYWRLDIFKEIISQDSVLKSNNVNDDASMRKPKKWHLAVACLMFILMGIFIFTNGRSDLEQARHAANNKVSLIVLGAGLNIYEQRDKYDRYTNLTLNLLLINTYNSTVRLEKLNMKFQTNNLPIGSTVMHGVQLAVGNNQKSVSNELILKEQLMKQCRDTRKMKIDVEISFNHITPTAEVISMRYLTLEMWCNPVPIFQMIRLRYKKTQYILNKQ